MFVRRKKNKSGIVSIQIIDKSNGKYKVVQTIGSSSDASEVDRLFKQAHLIKAELLNQSSINFDISKENELIKLFEQGLEQVYLVGPELLLGKIFDQIGFSAIKDDIFRHLVITRLVYPVSKLKTVDYLFRYKGISINVNQVYRYLDKLHEHQISKVKEISYTHTIKVLGGIPTVLFYDVTTLYFEAEQEDDLRKTGFSKDGKHQNPQIVLGLLASSGGYPIAYDIFEGNTYEGNTLIPILAAFKTQYKLEKLIVVADAGMLSKENVGKLIEKGDQYILGGRIKNENKQVQLQILSNSLKDGESMLIELSDNQSLIVSYSTKRATKDAFNRQRAISKLEKRIQSGKLTKQHLNNKGYNKFLKIEGELEQIKISIDEPKKAEDAKWDGLKGYLTNTTLTKEQVIEQYAQLWQIEKTFRISKSDLKVRPVYHFVKRRIESHLCIAFAACKIYKELERQLKEKKADFSVEQTIEILKTIYAITFKTPYSNQIKTCMLLKNEDQKSIVNLFNLIWVSQ